MSGQVVATLALKRRTLVERKALALLRGAEGAATLASGLRGRALKVPPTAAQARCFTELRRIAIRDGFSVLPPSAPYMGADELTVLAWLAAAQRVFAPDYAPEADPALRAAILRCAGLLDGMGLRLSTLTTCGAQSHDRTNRLSRTRRSRSEPRAVTMERA